MAEKSYRAWSPDHQFLFPPSMRDWLPEDHLVHFVMDVVAGLDLSAIERVLQEKDHRGERPWNPRMMVALLVYGYCLGIRSSRRLERATYEDVAFRFLTANEQPDHSSIASFRKLHLRALSDLFLQVLRLCQAAGMVKLGRVALDGTKVKANASRHKAMSYARMKEREAELREEIGRMLNEAGVADADEDAIHGAGDRGDELPSELRRRQDRLRKIEEAKRALEAEAAAARAAELAERERANEIPPEDPPPPVLPSHQVGHRADGSPEDKAQRNFTDPDSRIMKAGKDFVQGYNSQVVVDDRHQVILATGVTNQAPDAQHLPPMMAAVEANMGARPVEALGDAGYYSAKNVGYCERTGIRALLSVAREKHVLDDGPSPWPEVDPRAAMHARLRSVLGAAAYRRRKCIVEPVFGQIKEARGIRTFLLRGLEKVRGEWNLICLTHNMLKLFRFTQQSAFARA